MNQSKNWSPFLPLLELGSFFTRMIDSVYGFSSFRYTRLIAVESLRLFPQPPLLIRRSLKPDRLPGIRTEEKTLHGKNMFFFFLFIKTDLCLSCRRIQRCKGWLSGSCWD